MKVTTTTISISKLKLDIENPRYNDLRIIKNITKWSEEKLQKMIEEEDISDIKNSIKLDGIRDPLWIIKKNDGYLVIEGNRRLVTLRVLINEEVIPPMGKKFQDVPVTILPSTLSESEIDKQRMILQSGKKKWSAFNVASAITKLSEYDKFSDEEIARVMKKKIRDIVDEKRNFIIYKEYTTYRKSRNLSEDVRKYSYFQRVGKSTKKIFLDDKVRRIEFFELITERSESKDQSKKNNARIPNVSLRGGLMRFNRIADHPDILKKFLNTAKMTVEQANDLIDDVDIYSGMPWLKHLEVVAEGLIKMNEEDITKLKKDKVTFVSLKEISKIYTKIKEN